MDFSNSRSVLKTFGWKKKGKGRLGAEGFLSVYFYKQYLSDNLNKLLSNDKDSVGFNHFYKKYKEYYPNNKIPNKEFLEWFIGFTEGDGSFITTNNNEFFVVITQSESDLNILNYIKDNLKMGNIMLQSKKNKVYRLSIRKKLDIYLICLIFNGNMVLPSRQQRFLQFLIAYNEYIIKYANDKFQIISPINKCVLPSLKGNWISGFTDAEGCFSCSILSNSNVNYRVRFILSQKWDINKHVLEHILLLFSSQKFSPKNPSVNTGAYSILNPSIDSGEISKLSEDIPLIGSVVPHSLKYNWELRINGLKNCSIILSYFDEHPLLTKKGISYKKFKDILERIKNKEHMDPIKRQNLKRLAKDINK